jgi:hypothetical protein
MIIIPAILAALGEPITQMVIRAATFQPNAGSSRTAILVLIAWELLLLAVLFDCVYTLLRPVLPGFLTWLRFCGTLRKRRKDGA